MALNTQWGFKGNRGNNHTTITNSTSETEIIPGYINQNGDAIFADPYAIIIANTSGAACNVTIRDSLGGAIRDVIVVPAGETRGWSVPKDSARQQTTGNQQWTATCSASVSSIEITTLFVKNS